MKMHDQNHPHDERLAALAGGDPEHATDGELRVHVDACDACGAVVAELSSLRSALGDLPDLVPSRPIQLIPPVPEPQHRRGALTWVRSLVAPALVAGSGLVLVGAVGLGSVVAGGMAAQAGAAPDEDAVVEGAGEPAESTAQGPQFTSMPFTSPTEEDGDSGERSASRDDFQTLQALADTSSPTPWLVLLGAGAGLLIVALFLRFFVAPRAG